MVYANQEATLEHQRLKAALGRLSPEDRNILLKVVLDGLTYEDVAQSLRVPVGTVRTRIARARLTLCRELGHQTPGYAEDWGASAENGRSHERTDYGYSGT